MDIFILDSHACDNVFAIYRQFALLWAYVTVMSVMNHLLAILKREVLLQLFPEDAWRNHSNNTTPHTERKRGKALSVSALVTKF